MVQLLQVGLALSLLFIPFLKAEGDQNTEIQPGRLKLLQEMTKKFCPAHCAQIDAFAQEIANMPRLAEKPSRKTCCPSNFNIAQLQNTLNIILADIEALASCSTGTITITPADIGTAGYNINAPGKYCLAAHTTFSPAIAGLSAININASNVTLDLNGHTITKVGGVADVNGITVNGASNVSIYNGTVRGFSLYGVRINPGSTYVTLSHVNAFNNGTAETISGGIVITSGLTPDLATHDVFLDHVQASQNIFIGLTVAGADNVLVKDSAFDNNVGTTVLALGGTAVWGIFAATLFGGGAVNNLAIVNSQANSNTSEGGAIGAEILSIPAFLLPTNLGFNVVNSIFNGNQGGGDLTSVNEGEGLVIAGTSGFVVKDSFAQNNNSLAAAPSGTPGFYASVGFGVPFSCSNGAFINCYAQGNSGSGDVSAGFRVTASDNITFENCVAEGNNNPDDGGEAWGYTTDTNFGNPTAFGTPVNNNYIFNNCTAQGNIGAGISGGFKFISQAHSVLSNSVSNGNSGFGILAGDPVCCATAPVGCVCPSVANVITNNQIVGNTTNGILDNAPAAFTAYISNYARSNGGVGANYSGLPAGTPIRIWTLPGAPAPLDSNGILDPQLDNMDIRP